MRDRARTSVAIFTLAIFIASGGFAQDAPAVRPTTQAGTAGGEPSTRPVDSRPSQTQPADSQPATQSAPATHPAPATQTAPATQPAISAALPTAEEVQQRISDAEANTALDDAARAELVKLYKDLLAELNRAAQFAQRLERLKTDSIPPKPEELEALRAPTTQPIGEIDAGIPADATVAVATGLVAEAKTSLEERNRALAEIEAEQKRRDQRRADNPREVTSIGARIAELSAAAQPGEKNEAPLRQEARRLLRQARLASLAQENAMLAAELPAYAAQSEMLTARRDLAARDALIAERLVKAREAALQNLQRREAEKAAMAAEKALAEAAAADPAVKQLLLDNAKFASEVEKYTTETDRIRNYRTRTDARLEQLKIESQSMREIVSLLGADRQIGGRLRQQRVSLPSTRDYEIWIANNDRRRADAEFRRIEITSRSGELGVLDESVKATMKLVDPDVEGEQLRRIEEAVRRALADQKKLVDDLKDNRLRAYLEEVTPLREKLAELVRLSRDYENFINQHVFWIPSAPIIGPGIVAGVVEGGARFTQPADWVQTGEILVTDLFRERGVYAVFCIVVLTILALQRWLRMFIRARGERVAKPATDRFSYTLQVLVATVLLAAAGPTILAFAGWRLVWSIDALSWQNAIGAGLLQAALAWGFISVLIHLCRPNGLAEAHFRWRPASIRVMRRNLAWLGLFIVPCAFVSHATQAFDDEVPRQTLGRLAFMIEMFALAAFTWRVIHPENGIVANLLNRSRNSWLSRLRYVWFTLAVGVPLVLGIVSGLGFDYTALQFSIRFTRTLELVAVLFVVSTVTLRWLFVAQRKIAIEQAERRKAAEAEQPDDIPAEVPTPVELPELNILALSAQTRQLLYTFVGLTFFFGSWMIWKDVLPALEFLKEYRLDYSTSVDSTSAGENKSAGGESKAGADGSKGSGTTLADLVVAIVIIVITIVLGKNLPALLEMAILTRLPLEPSVRYAITSLVRYVISIVGFIAAFGALGIGWSKVQWLAAAITFGLGFGLQEIFANFVSGLILLFERPIRLGDLVTVGDVSGTVTKIRIRATTITDFDRKELIVPNKDLIVGRVLNWTLSDSTLRLVLPIGVAYGTSIETVFSVLTRIARDCEYLLKDPAPQVLFMGFGDSTLNFELRVVVSIEHGLAARHELNTAIDSAFRRAGIEFAFPQRDLNLKIGDARLLELLKGKSGEPKAEPSE